MFGALALLLLGAFVPLISMQRAADAQMHEEDRFSANLRLLTPTEKSRVYADLDHRVALHPAGIDPTAPITKEGMIMKQEQMKTSATMAGMLAQRAAVIGELSVSAKRRRAVVALLALLAIALVALVATSVLTSWAYLAIPVVGIVAALWHGQVKTKRAMARLSDLDEQIAKLRARRGGAKKLAQKPAAGASSQTAKSGRSVKSNVSANAVAAAETAKNEPAIRDLLAEGETVETMGKAVSVAESSVSTELVETVSDEVIEAEIVAEADDESVIDSTDDATEVPDAQLAEEEEPEAVSSKNADEPMTTSGGIKVSGEAARRATAVASAPSHLGGGRPWAPRTLPPSTYQLRENAPKRPIRPLTPPAGISPDVPRVVRPRVARAPQTGALSSAEVAAGAGLLDVDSLIESRRAAAS
ncbi:hypothetical protein BK816_02375 [Boudabousia tangfeifanii]|uniref:Uncharacterized protein n=1 Tax=Boudabousia tangfeifanii TaxID=1912795 RepID=A0A1D9MJA1_9ACTO|nr:hypothetical protein [Boudabousia tangfeifanii]AOZ72288.1 hypothetical protein BK816_02375 [Boudabousia tangfeifanii]